MTKTALYLDLLRRRFGSLRTDAAAETIISLLDRRPDGVESALDELWQLSASHAWAWETLLGLALRAGDRRERLPRVLEEFVVAALTDERARPKPKPGQHYRDMTENVVLYWLFDFLTRYFGMTKTQAYDVLSKDADNLTALSPDGIRKAINRMHKLAPDLFGHESARLFP